jgi:hypothetical protein
MKNVFRGEENVKGFGTMSGGIVATCVHSVNASSPNFSSLISTHSCFSGGNQQLQNDLMV